MSPADIEEESKDPCFFWFCDPLDALRDRNVMNLYSHNQVITKFLFILNTADDIQWQAFTVLASTCLIWVCVYVQVFPCVLWLLCEGVPKRKGLDIPIREMKATWPQKTHGRWPMGSKLSKWWMEPRLAFGLGDGCLMIFVCLHESDLLGFMVIYVVLLSLSIRYVEMCWDILYIWELGRSVLCSWLESPGSFSDERTRVCFRSCLETKT